MPHWGHENISEPGLAENLPNVPEFEYLWLVLSRLRLEKSCKKLSDNFITVSTTCSNQIFVTTFVKFIFSVTRNMAETRRCPVYFIAAPTKYNGPRYLYPEFNPVRVDVIFSPVSSDDNQ